MHPGGGNAFRVCVSVGLAVFVVVCLRPGKIREVMKRYLYLSAKLRKDVYT